MNENAKKWVEALRSGEFKQATEVLEDGYGGFCCLAVACIIYERETGNSLPRSENGTLNLDSVDGELIEEFDVVREWLGLGSGHGHFYGKPFCSSLLAMNDSGASFTRIANIIESKPRGLFVC